MILTVLGCGWSLSRDVSMYGIVGDVMAVNHCIINYPKRIKYACAIDYNKVGKEFLEMRRALGYNMDFELFRKSRNVVASFGNVPCENRSEKGPCGVTINSISLKPNVNESGIFAALVGRHLGYDDIRILGCPADGMGHYYDIEKQHKEPKMSKSARTMSRNLCAFSGVKSASGLTADILGGIEL